MIDQRKVAELCAHVMDEDTETLIMSEHGHDNQPEFIVAVPTAELPESYYKAVLTHSHEGPYMVYMNDDFKIFHQSSCRTIYEHSKAPRATLELLMAAEFGLQLLRLSETFDINLGRGWKLFKERAEPAVKKAKGEI